MSKIDNIWDKGKPIRGKNPDVWRRDSNGNKIRKPSYGTLGEYGWEVDHKHPKSKGGSNNIRNLQPLHWEANREKSDKIKK
ncbi:MAG: HNH endonuclease [Alphaproteobacteria bacterium]|nr:HNH endonuclease [Alphaproteobacteria bacterium]